MPIDVIAKFTLDDPILDTLLVLMIDQQKKRGSSRDSSLEILIRAKGEVWEIHRYDKDPFPSNPHAHNVESGLKLDLSTGKIYFRRKLVQELSKKQLIEFRDRPELKNIDLPPLMVA